MQDDVQGGEGNAVLEHVEASLQALDLAANLPETILYVQNIFHFLRTLEDDQQLSLGRFQVP